MLGILRIAALGLLFGIHGADAQTGCCAANGGPTAVCSATGFVVCGDASVSTCLCGSSTSPPTTLGQLFGPAQTSFGSINMGTTSMAAALTVTNLGALPVSVSAVTSQAPQEFVIVGNTCKVVPGGGSCTISVAFRPLVAALRSTYIQVVSNGVGSPQSFLVIGTGFAPSASTPPPGSTAPTIDVVEFRHGEWNHYFVTAVPAEIAKLDDGTFAGWRRTGLAFKAWPNGLPGTASMCRFFSTAFGERSSHFYTPDAKECALVKGKPEWSFEGDVFGVVLPSASGSCPQGLLALYRLYNDGQGGAPNHRYTLDGTVRAVMMAFGWVPEGYGTVGVIACVPA
ncbi:MAG: choice-of-anchor D domain-containing protein [Burkholderiales bacterium]